MAWAPPALGAEKDVPWQFDVTGEAARMPVRIKAAIELALDGHLKQVQSKATRA
jgi:hypothetical protein